MGRRQRRHLNSNWDFFTTDWTNTATHAAASLSDGALVTFDDSGRTNVVNLTATFNPAGVTVSQHATHNYTFTGAGMPGGTNGVTKLGSGTLDLGQHGRRQLQRRPEHRRRQHGAGGQ